MAAHRRVAGLVTAALLAVLGMGMADAQQFNFSPMAASIPTLSTGGGTAVAFRLNVNGGATVMEDVFYQQTFFVGNLTLKQLFPCTLVVPTSPAPSPTTPASSQDMTCLAAAGYGPWIGQSIYRLYSPSVSDADGFAPGSNLSYVSPRLQELSLRTNRSEPTGDGVLPVELPVEQSPSVTLYVDGVGFFADPQVTTVRYGLGGVNGAQALWWPCTLWAEATTSTTLACNTTAGAYGRRLALVVTVAGHDTPVEPAPLANRISYAYPPRIDSVKGCDDAQGYVDPTTNGFGPELNGTSACPTAGGTVLTVRGAQLFAPLTVYIDGTATCRNPACPSDSMVCDPTPPPCAGTQPGSCLVCALPSRTGARPALTVSLPPDPFAGAGPARYTAQVTAYLFGYGRPRIDVISGCDPVPAPATSFAIRDCPKHGGSRVNLTGTNFGPANAWVRLVEAPNGTFVANVTDVVHDPVTPHSKLSFTVPPGTGVQFAVAVTSAPTPGAYFTLSTQTNRDQIALSYFQCPPGQVVKGDPAQALVNCTACPVGSYSANADAQDCLACAPGTASPIAGAASCTVCAAGTIAPGVGADVCVACVRGSFNPFSGAVRCNACPPGRVAPLSGSADCTSCPVATYQPANGSLTCDACPSGRFASSVGSTACSGCTTGTFDGFSCSAATSIVGGGMSAPTLLLYGVLVAIAAMAARLPVLAV